MIPIGLGVHQTYLASMTMSWHVWSKQNKSKDRKFVGGFLPVGLSSMEAEDQILWDLEADRWLHLSWRYWSRNVG